MFKKHINILFIILLLGQPCLSQNDTSSLNSKKGVEYLIGVDILSSLNLFSVIGGIEVNKSRFGISLSHVWNSSRIGIYYDYYIAKKYKVLAGLGFHNSFQFEKFDISRSEYEKLLKEENWQAERPDFAFLPNYGEVRHLYFFSASLGKEFKLFKGLCINLKVEGLYCINPFYDNSGFSGLYGAQLYYKW